MRVPQVRLAGDHAGERIDVLAQPFGFTRNRVCTPCRLGAGSLDRGTTDDVLRDRAGVLDGFAGAAVAVPAARDCVARIAVFAVAAIRTTVWDTITIAGVPRSFRTAAVSPRAVRAGAAAIGAAIDRVAGRAFVRRRSQQAGQEQGNCQTDRSHDRTAFLPNHYSAIAGGVSWLRGACSPPRWRWDWLQALRAALSLTRHVASAWA